MAQGDHTPAINGRKFGNGLPATYWSCLEKYQVLVLTSTLRYVPTSNYHDYVEIKR
ncbi:hypothetical protein BGZ65_009308, partial [Modicella reniformis]